jgi:hypothetical protein
VKASRLTNQTARIPDPWQILDEGPHGGGWLAPRSSPEPEPPAERPSPSPAVHRGRGVEPGSISRASGEHGEAGEAPGAARRIDAGEPAGTLRANEVTAAPYRCHRCGTSSPPVAHWLDLADWARVYIRPGVWVPSCPRCCP